MRAANLATVCRMPFGAAFDNPEIIVSVVVGDVLKPKPVLLRHPGIPTNF